MKKITFETLTPRELGYILALQGLLASDESAKRYPYETVNAAIKLTDLLFERIKDQRDIQEKAS
jgi:hypothetical protein